MQTQQHSDKDGLARRRQPAPPRQAFEAQAYEAPTLGGLDLSRLPAGRGTSGLRQRAMIQAQRRHGNQFVQRMDFGGLFGASAARQMTLRRRAGPGLPGAPHPRRSTDGGATVSVSGGVVNIDAPMINLNAPLVRTDGVLQTDTIIANTVVGSSYTPGAGKL